MVKILYITDKSLVGCSYYRCILPALTMDKENNTESFYSPLPNVEMLNEADLVIQQRNVGNFKAVLDYCNKYNIPILFENDDNDYCIPADNAMGEVFKNSGWLDEQKEVLRRVDGVLTTTETLKSFFSQYNKNSYVIPNCLDLSLPVWNLPKEEKDYLEIIWSGGSSHLMDLKSISGLIPVRETPKPKVIFCMCGYDVRIANFRTNTVEGKKVTRSMVENNYTKNIWNQYLEGFSDLCNKGLIKIKRTLPINEFPRHYVTADIGVAPLVKNLFTPFKSPLKFLELSAFSIPGVYSDIFPFTSTVEHGVDGFIAKKPKEWTKYLNMLIDDEELRIKMGKAGRKKVEEKFETKVINKLRYKIYCDVIKKKGDRHKCLE